MSRSKVGHYNTAYNVKLGRNLPDSDIYCSSGLSVHVQSRHPDSVQYLPSIPAIIAAPDYIGCSRNEPNGMEYIKHLQDNVAVCIKLDGVRGDLYVATLYIVTPAKLQNRLNSGRIVRT